MNARQLMKIGCPEDCVQAAIEAIQNVNKLYPQRQLRPDYKVSLQAAIDKPDQFLNDPCFADFAKALVENRNFTLPAPIPYKVWGSLEDGVEEQMKLACSLPTAVGAAVMPDNHLGYGLPIGGVLALKNAVCPYAVGVDIACRMSLSVFDLPINSLERKFNFFKEAIAKSTRFGIGEGSNAVFDQPKHHPVMDEDWNITRVTRQQKDKAWKQLGTSGSGNHFADFGILHLPTEFCGLAAGDYVAVMTHSGSRGPGSAVCKTYHEIAQAKLDRKYADLRNLAWLDIESSAGQEYWLAMELMGRFAQANHQLIHKALAKCLKADILLNVENHHNFAWKELHNLDQGEVIVHRKGATPAGAGELGVIPGSMGTPAYIVRGKGKLESLCSASHGAGRLMSRKKAKEKYSWKAVQGNLDKQGITVLDATADESPGVYKPIEEVMAAQSDLVEIIAQFEPRIVKMCGDGSPSED